METTYVADSVLSAFKVFQKCMSCAGEERHFFKEALHSPACQVCERELLVSQ